ncbi:putative gustatory receptor 28a [Monomorium pharaonis]|uniref:putative gustatory receptor 28a n=1 Tax=Monomorium pharaonis TaxID=307658 RepID=UPI00063FCA8B|nr:putative gustatory receptor 28a [Monomorium pharaonis]
MTMLSLLPKFQREIKDRKERKRWWLFHATDFQSLMYPCFIFCRILGIFPYKINASSFETSKSSYLLSTIVMCIFCFCAIIIIMDVSGWFSIQNLHETIQLNSFYMFGSIIMVVTFVLSGPRMRLLQTILKVSSRLPSQIYRKQSMLIHAKDIFGFFFLLVQTFIFYNNMQLSVLVKVNSLYISLLVFQMDMLYINCACILKACFKRINDNLAHLFINDKSNLIRWINHEYRNSLLLVELKTLKKQHLMVSNAVKMLNIIFSPQLLATIAVIFIMITFEIYFNMVQWENGLFISWTKQIYHIIRIPYIAYYLIKIALIAWTCESSKNQAIKISTTVHEILNNTDDKQIKHELQLFSLQIMHHNNIFSPKGLNLDATLITTMTSTIATYVLILIQFLIASHSCDEKTESTLYKQFKSTYAGS